MEFHMKQSMILLAVSLLFFSAISCSTKKTIKTEPVIEPATVVEKMTSPPTTAYEAPEPETEVEETVITGNSAEDAIAITITEENQVIGPFKLTNESSELWLSMNFEAMNSYFFDSKAIEGDGTVSALVLGPPDKKVHGGSVPVGDNGHDFSVVYKETMNNSHYLKIILGEGDEWKGTVSYHFSPTK